MSGSAWLYLAITLACALTVGLTVAASARQWIPFDIPVGLMVLAVYSPGLVAMVLAGVTGGRGELARLLRPLAAWRVSWRWYGVALLLPFAVNALALGLFLLSGAPAPTLPGPLPKEVQALATLPILPYLSLTVFQLSGSLAEEIGWRGYALPRLQRQLPALDASLAIGAVWALWHVPLFLMPDTTQAQVPFGWYVIYVPAVSVLFTWLYNHTGGSLIPVTLFHASIQAANVYLPVLGPTLLYALSVLATVALALSVIAILGRRLV